jgi:hypothetical protein
MFIPQQPISISTCAIPINQDTPPMEKKSGLGKYIANSKGTTLRLGAAKGSYTLEPRNSKYGYPPDQKSLNDLKCLDGLKPYHCKQTNPEYHYPPTPDIICNSLIDSNGETFPKKDCKLPLSPLPYPNPYPSYKPCGICPNATASTNLNNESEKRWRYFNVLQYNSSIANFVSSKGIYNYSQRIKHQMKKKQHNKLINKNQDNLNLSYEDYLKQQKSEKINDSFIRQDERGKYMKGSNYSLKTILGQY